MTMTRIEEKQLDMRVLPTLTQKGPVVVLHEGMPVFIIQPVTPEWLEALAAEEEVGGDMSLEEYAKRYNITLDLDSYRREFPVDTSLTFPSK